MEDRMKDLISKDMSRNILAGIVASMVFTFLLQPIGQSLWGIAVYFSNSIFSGWLDAIYSEAALGINIE